MHLVPGVAHGGVHVAEMQLFGGGEHPLGHQVVAAEHQRVVGQIELLDRQRQQRQVLLHMADAPGQALDERGVDRAALQPAAGTAALAIHQRKQLHLSAPLGGEEIHLPHHQFGPAGGARGEPLVHQSQALGQACHV